MGYNPWDRKEPDMTEGFSLSQMFKPTAEEGRNTIYLGG